MLTTKIVSRELCGGRLIIMESPAVASSSEITRKWVCVYCIYRQTPRSPLIWWLQIMTKGRRNFHCKRCRLLTSRHQQNHDDDNITHSNTLYMIWTTHMMRYEHLVCIAYMDERTLTLALCDSRCKRSSLRFIRVFFGAATIYAVCFMAIRNICFSNLNILGGRRTPNIYITIRQWFFLCLFVKFGSLMSAQNNYIRSRLLTFDIETSCGPLENENITIVCVK